MRKGGGGHKGGGGQMGKKNQHKKKSRHGASAFVPPPPEHDHESHAWKWDDPEAFKGEGVGKWVHANAAEHKETVTVISWNILAEAYCYFHFYKHLKDPGRVLDWNSRSKQIFAHLRSMDADIMCLQEVQDWGTLRCMFADYDGVYEERTGHKVDG